MEKHEFALYFAPLSSLIIDAHINDVLDINDEKLVHRIIHVLRLQLQEHCILFDRDTYIKVIIISFNSKKQIRVKIQALHKTAILKPNIVFLLPVFKRDDYESALYALAELGVTTIQLVFTQKTTHQWSTKEKERAEKILIAAAEQSKNFAYPELKDPLPFEKALKKYDTADTKIFFDPQGKRLLDVITTLSVSPMKEIVLLVGPEGDLSSPEKQMLHVHNFTFCALTPTIVRAVQAVTLGAGFIRSIT